MSVTPPPNIDYPRSGHLPSRLMLGMIAICGAVYMLSLGLAGVLLRCFPPVPTSQEISFPIAFWPSTVLLMGGSWLLHQAREAVRREKQQRFRRNLVWALVMGTLFIGVQTYGLACMFRNQQPEEVQTGANAFVAMLTAIHALHFTLAVMCLVFVMLQAYGNRYDHEYHWGVTVCVWFWHALGVIWTAVLMVFAIALRAG